MDKILIAAASPQTKDWIVRALSSASLTLDNYHVASPSELKAALRRQTWAMILLDTALLPLTTDEMLQQTPITPVFLLADHPTTAQTVDWMRAGARGVIEKNDADTLLRLVKAELQATSPSNPLYHLLDTTQEAIYSFSLPDHQLIYKSASLEAVFGYPLESFLEDPDFFKKVVHPDDLPAAIAAMQKGRIEGFVEIDHRIILPDGHIRWLHRRVWINRNERGEPTSVYDSSRDITRQKEAEEALRQSEANFRTLFNTVQDFLFVLDMQGNIQEVNRTAIQRLGYTQAELLHQSIIMVHPPDRREEARQIISEMLQDTKDDCLVPLQTKEGHQIPVETSVTQGVWNGQPALFGVSKDISALKRSEEKFAAIFQANPAIAGLSKVANGHYVEVNPAFCEKLGFTPEEVIGKRASEVVRLDEKFRATTIEKLKTQGYIRGEEAVIYTKDGTPLPVLLYADLLTIDNELYNFTIAVDITDLKQATDALHAREAQLKTILTSIPDIILHMDEDGTMLDFQGGVSTIIPKEQIVGKNIRDFFNSPYAPVALVTEVWQTVQQVKITGQMAILEYELPTPSGQVGRYEARFAPIENSNEVLIISRDITEIHQNQVSLKTSEEKYRSLIESSDAAISMVDADGRYLYLNSISAFPYGVPPDALVGKTVHELFPPDQANQILRDVQQVIAQETGMVLEPEVTINGKACWFRTSIQPVRDGKGKPYAAFIHASEITSQKEAELALSTSEERYRNVVENQTEMVCRYDAHLRLKFGNVAYCKNYGVSPDEIVGKSILDKIPPEEHAQVWAHLRSLTRENPVAISVHQSIQADGSVRWTEWKDRALFDADGKIIEYQGVGRDITERKRAEDALLQSETYLRSLVDSQTAFNVRVDMEGKFSYCNRRYEEKFGWFAPSLIGMSSLAMVLPEDHYKVEEAVAYCLNNVGSPVQVEIRKQTAYGGHLWTIWEFIAIQDKNGEVKEIQCVGFDITRQKQAEEALRRSEQRYRQMFELHGLPKLILDPGAGHILDANPAAAQFYGYTVETLKTLSIFDINLSPIHEVKAKMAKAATQEMLSCQFIHRSANGNPCDVEVFTGPIEIEGRQRLYSIVTDITEKERAKKALQEAHDSLEHRVIERTAELEKVKNRIEAIFNHSGDGILLLDIHRGIQQANYAFDSMFGVDENSYFGAELSAFFAPENTAALEKTIQDVAATHQNQHLEVRAQRTDGTPFDVEISIAPVNRSNHSVFNLVCIIRDITERKQAQQAIAEERNLLRTLIDAIPDYIYIKDIQHRMVLNNAAHAAALKLSTPSEAVGKTDFDFFPEAMAANFYYDEKMLLHTQKSVVNIEERSLGQHGQEIWAMTSKVPLRNLNGEIIGLVGITRDISERKAQEAAIRESEERYRTTLAAMSEGIVVQEKSGAIRLCNAAAEQILGLSADQMMGRTSIDPRWQAIHPDGSPFPGETHPAMLTLQTGQPQSNVIMGVHKPDGALTWILINSQPLTTPDDPIPYAVVATFTDITERKLSEEALEQKHLTELEMQFYLKSLHQMSIEIARSQTLDEFYKQTVELGLTHFGFERMGLLLYDPITGEVVGTYGTDKEGNLAAEHHLRFQPSQLTGILQKSVERTERFAFHEKAELFANFEPIGTGQNAAAALWNGELLGWLAVDNAVSHHPISQAKLDILALYALTIGSLLARKRAEFALRESESRYRLLAENVKDVIVKFTPDGLRTFVTPSIYDLLGYHPEELIGRLVIEVIHPDDRQKRQEVMWEALTSGAAFFNITQRMQHKDGHFIWVDVTNTIVRDEQGKPIEVIGVIHDITERKNSEDALRESEEKFRQLIESAPIATVITDQNGLIILVNKEVENRFGYTRAELIGQAIEILVPNDLRTKHISNRKDFLKTGINRKHGLMELAARRKDGSVFPADIQLSHIDMTPNNMVMIFIIDVTQRKQAEESLKQALAHEKELGELKSRFVSMASHEFRTPLATILATTETLTIYRDKMNTEQINLRLDKIRQQVNYMKNIMDDVLQLARIQAGRVEFKPTDGDLDALCLQIIEEFDSQADTQGRIRYTCPTTPLIFNFDERLMRHILSNLISNALKYSGKEKPVFLDITDTESQVTLTIQDQGIGIPPDDLKHLFEPFHRATNVGTISGTGLGLSIAKQAVDLHQGTIAPESQVDLGTKFIVRLPKGRG